LVEHRKRLRRGQIGKDVSLIKPVRPKEGEYVGPQEKAPRIEKKTGGLMEGY